MNEKKAKRLRRIMRARIPVGADAVKSAVRVLRESGHYTERQLRRAFAVVAKKLERRARTVTP